MASTIFVPGTTIASSWLNDINTGIYNTIPTLASLISPSFTTPTLGVATATTINKVTLTTPATGATLTIADGKNLIASNTVTLAGTDNSTINYGTGGTLGTVGYSTATPTNGWVLTGNGTSWIAALPASTSVVRSARTSNTILVAGDNGSFIDITSGSFTQTFTAASVLGNGWFCYIRASNTSDILLDPNGSELIDGLTSYTMYPNEVRLITCTGTGFVSIILNPFNRSFTSSGTFTTPPGYAYFAGRVWSGGGGGGKAGSLGTFQAGGGGGGCADFIFPSVTLGSSQTVTIGAGGAGSAGPTGGLGGDTSLGSLFAVYSSSSTFNNGNSVQPGLVTTLAAANPPVGYEGGFSTTAPYNALSSIWGGGGSSITGTAGGKVSIYGAAGGGSIDSSNTIRAPGTSLFGGNGGAASSTGTASSGVAPGGGGGATQTGTAGSGARGELRIWGVC